MYNGPNFFLFQTQTVPLKDYEELRFKLKILENKRHEDRERFREYEKVKEEAEQFLTLRNKLQGKLYLLKNKLVAAFAYQIDIHQIKLLSYRKMCVIRNENLRRL